MAKLTLEQALAVSAESRAVLGSAAGPEAQTKAKEILTGALDVLVEAVKSDKKQPAAPAKK